MLIDTKKVTTEYTRPSKNNKSHTYTRTKTLLVLQCDDCQNTFEREQGKMCKQRTSPDYYHVCPNCDAKRFAQKRGAERRKIWNLSADSDIDISKI
jgi:DNA-directed RNA polymerase subunit RPC12/RpoP